MNLIVGLGNPGKKYEHNRHNIGFSILNKYWRKYNLKIKIDNSYIYTISGDSVMIKPTTFMNRVGCAIKEALNNFTIDDILIVVDEVYLPFGEIRFRDKGGDGGHNGLKSIIESLNSEYFKRMRFGVGREQNVVLSEYVLQDFTGEEQNFINNEQDFFINLLFVYSREGYQALLNYYSINKVTYSESIRRIQNQ